MCNRVKHHVSGIASAHNELVCSTWGNHHFLMFDGNLFQLPSMCNHILTSQCGGSYEYFNVQMRREIVNGEPTISKISLKLDGAVVELRKGLIIVNGQTWAKLETSALATAVLMNQLLHNTKAEIKKCFDLKYEEIELKDILLYIHFHQYWKAESMSFKYLQKNLICVFLFKGHGTICQQRCTYWKAQLLHLHQIHSGANSYVEWRWCLHGKSLFFEFCLQKTNTYMQLFPSLPFKNS